MAHTAESANTVDDGTAIKSENQRSDLHSSPHPVLTLYGGDRSAKQLFSSLGKRKIPDDFNELALPNGISTTTVLPTHSIAENDEKKPIMRDLLAGSTNLPQLPTPRPSQHTTTRSSTLKWHKPTINIPKKTSDRKHTFATQPLTTGTWLTYNVPPTQRPDSPETKRRHRERRLSYGGEPQSPTNAEALAAHSHAKDDALFQSVYSSFAPDRDDTLAVIPSQQKSRMWWHTYGHERYQDLLDMKEDELYDLEDEDVPQPDEKDLDEETIKTIVEGWEPPNDMANEKLEINGFAESEVDDQAQQLLDEISELIEALSSYQRVRHETLPNPARPPTGHTASINSSVGTPSEPSSTEVEVYKKLRARLSSLISDLPPYLLSKVDSDQLGALKISTKIQIEAMNHKGTMEDGELSASIHAAARSAVPVAAAAAQQPPVPYSNVGVRGGSHTPQSHGASFQHARSSYAGHAASTPANVQAAYAASQYGSRTAPQQYANRAPFPNQHNYNAQRQPSHAERFSQGAFNSPQNYNQYPNGYRPPVRQPSTYNQQQQQYSPPARTPATVAAPAHSYRPTPADYQQRAAAAHAYNYGHMPSATTAAGSPQPHHRPQYPPQSQNQHQPRPQMYHQSSSTQGSRTSAEPQTNGTGGSAARLMSPGDHAAAMNPQKAQWAEQQRQQQQQQQAAFRLQQQQTLQQQQQQQQPARQHSGTPQPQPTTTNGVQANGANGMSSSQ